MGTLQKIIIGESTLVIGLLIFVERYWHAGFHLMATIVLLVALTQLSQATNQAKPSDGE